MKTIKLIRFTTLFVIGTLIILTSCKKDTVPTVNTLQVTDITNTTASCGGDILDDGGDEIIESGICWSNMGVPTISNFKTTDGTKTGSFLSQMSDLEPGIPYTVRAYATNGVGTAYGNSMGFTTKSLPVITTNDITEITKTSAKCGGFILTIDDTEITNRGVCWCVCDTPTIENYFTSDGSGTEDFLSTLTNLTPGTTYSICAYATTEFGTTYGEIKSFSTNDPELPVVTTNNISNITDISASCGGNISTDGGSPVTSRGIIWGTSSSITLDNNIGFTNDGSGTGGFNSSITDLEQNTTYYVKAYATNDMGTSYGSSKYFTTDHTVLPPTVEIGDINEILDHSALGSLVISSTGYGNITNKGLCWSTYSNPTSSNNHSAPINSETIGSTTHRYVRMSSLSANTTYYVRAYATNSSGTGYSEQISFTTAQNFTCGNTIMDASGNTYNTIELAGKCWMQENLNTNRLNNGHIIDNTSEITWALANASSLLSCMYDNSNTNANTYGRLYNGYAALSNNLCPTGWHVATKDEWESLTSIYDGNDLKESGETYWYYCNDNTGTNSSNFYARGGGYRIAYYINYGPTYNAEDKDMGNYGYWWSSTTNENSELWQIRLRCFSSQIDTYYSENKKYGKSIRCVKD